MHTFKVMNTSTGDTCPICKTQDDGEVVLIGLVGTQKDGIVEAKQFHLRCLDLLYDPKHGVIYQTFK